MEEQTSKQLLPKIEQAEIERSESNPFLINSWPQVYQESFLHPFEQPINAQNEFHTFLQQTRGNWLTGKRESIEQDKLLERMLQLGREQKMLVPISHHEVRSMLEETKHMPLHRIPDSETRQVFDYMLGRERKGGYGFYFTQRDNRSGIAEVMKEKIIIPSYSVDTEIGVFRALEFEGDAIGIARIPGENERTSTALITRIVDEQGVNRYMPTLFIFFEENARWGHGKEAAIVLEYRPLAPRSSKDKPYIGSVSEIPSPTEIVVTEPKHKERFEYGIQVYPSSFKVKTLSELYGLLFPTVEERKIIVSRHPNKDYRFCDDLTGAYLDYEASEAAFTKAGLQRIDTLWLQAVNPKNSKNTTKTNTETSIS